MAMKEWTEFHATKSSLIVRRYSIQLHAFTSSYLATDEQEWNNELGWSIQWTD